MAESLAALWNALFTWPVLIVLCLTLGLAPFFPEPHLWDKLRLLFAGELRRAIDGFDLALHGAPWLLLAAKALLAALGR
jgi:hypothetical protein